MADDKKRRLPLWMAGVTAADQLRKSGNRKDEEEEEYNVSVNNNTKTKKTKKTKKESSSNFSIVRCETVKNALKKTRGRRRPRMDLDDDDDDSLEAEFRRTSEEEERPKRRKTRSRKKQLEPKSFEDDDDDDNEEDIEDDCDLTVDDLVTIAQEYVKADEGKKHQQDATTKFESVKHIPGNLPFSRNESEASIYSETAQSSSNLATQTILGHFRDHEDSAYENVSSNPSRTGDSTRDMLDLFLGPLLKKHQAEDRKHEVMREIELDYELRKLSQKEVGVKEVPQGNAPPLMKKKSSLRDKVAMLLD